MRKGAGDGLGDCAGVGVCASALIGALEIVMAAAPAAGRTLTKLRRVIDVRFFFIESSKDFIAPSERNIYRPSSLNPAWRRRSDRY
jgi:hypothetical protein